jgi:uracil-DNA glycosylase
MFTGDRSGEWLFRALHKAGFATQPVSQRRDDALQLVNCCITAVVHCAPPDNKPSLDEIDNCQNWFDQVLDLVPARVIVALGQIAWSRLLAACQRREWQLWQGPKPRFAHGAKVPLSDGRWILASFHPSQQNTFTRRLTEPMFDAVFHAARELLNSRYDFQDGAKR